MYEKLAKLVDRLHERTKSNSIKWERADRNVFTTSFPNYSIDVGGDDWVIILHIYNEEGEIVDSISSDSFSQEPSSPEVDYGAKLRDLHKLARRSALRSDQVVDDLISVLEG